MYPQVFKAALAATALLGFVQGVVAQTWDPVSGDDRLTELFSDTVFETPLTDNATATAHYNADGTGQMSAWGVTYARTWKIEDGQVCVEIDAEFQCFMLEQNIDNQEATEIRGTNQATGEMVVFTVTSQGDSAQVVSRAMTDASEPDDGAPGKPSAEEVAAKLLNPSNPIMKIGNNFDYVTYDGDLPGAGDQTQFKYLFLTIFPFKLDTGNTIMVRPAIPVIFDQALPNGAGGYDDVGTDIADIGYDLIYTGMTKTGTLWAYGFGARSRPHPMTGWAKICGRWGQK